MRLITFITFLISAASIFAQNNYDLLFIKGEYDRIIEESRVLETPEDYYWQASMMDIKGSNLDAIEILNSGLEEFGETEKLEILLADLLYKSGQYSAAIPLLRKYDRQPGYFTKYINILDFKGEYSEAAGLLEDRIKKDTVNLEYLGLLGDIYYKADLTNLAIDVLTRILSINANDQSSILKLAQLYIKEKHFQKAVEISDLGLSIDSTNKKMIMVKGLGSFRNRDFQTSEICFRYLLQEGDSSKTVMKHLGISEYHNQLFKSSREHLLEAFQLDSSDYEVCYLLGNCYLNSPNPSKGLYFFDSVDSLMQPDGDVMSLVFYGKQSIYSTLEDYPQALLCYQKAYEYKPNPEFIFYIASLYQHKLEDPEKALKHYEQFLDLLPEKEKDERASEDNGDQFTISLKSVAERNIEILREELFFREKLKE